jgi:hypothetical protein
MALTKQTITLDFGFGGLDQKTDAKRLIPVKFSELGDAAFTKLGRVERRRAMEPWGTLSVTTARLLENGNLMAITAPDAALPRLWRFSADGVAFSQTTTNFMPIAEVVTKQCGPVQPWTTESVSSAWSRADSNNYYAITYWNDTSNATFVEIYDKTSGALCNSVSVGGATPQIFGHPDGRDEFVFGYCSSATVSFRLITPSTTPVVLSGLPDEGTVASLRWDAAVCADAAESTSAMIMVIYAKGASGVKLRNAAWPGSGGSGSTKSSTTIATATATTIVAMCGFSNPSNTTHDFRPVWHPSTTTATFSGAYNHSLTVQIAPGVLFDTTEPAQLSGVVLGDNTAHVWIGGSSLGFVQAYSVNASNTATRLGSSGGFGGGLRLTQLLTKPMGISQSSSGVSYAWASYSYTTNQATAFLLGAANGSLVHVQARAFHLRSWTNSPLNAPPCSMQWSRTEQEFITMIPRLNRSATVVGGDSGSGNWGFHAVRMRPNTGAHDWSNGVTPKRGGWSATKNKDELVVGGGWGSFVNGVDPPLPTAPLVFPVIKLQSVTSSGGALTAGSYQVSGFFEMVDGTGKVRRGEPAEPLTVTLSGTQVAFAVTVSNYGIADGLSGRVRFVATRTLVNESQVYYRDYSYATTSTTSAMSVSFTVADATIAAYEPMYTTGGIYEDSAASCLLTQATNGRRTLAVFGDDPTFVVESKPNSTAFMDGVGRRISGGGDRIYALASYQDRWFAFKEDGIYVASGDGADATGQNDTLSEFEQVVVGLGCVTPRSVLVTSAGIVFLSTRGFHIIGPDLVPRYIGADVETFELERKVNGHTLVDACHDPIGAYGDFTGATEEQGGRTGERCIFAFSDDENTWRGLTLTIVTMAQGVDLWWSERYFEASSVAASGGRLYGTPNSLAVSRESNEDSSNEYRSAADNPSLIATTAWVPMGSIQGLGRIYKSSIIGSVGNTSMTVTVAVGYDYSPNWSETHTVSTANMQNGEFEFSHQRTRCSAVRYRILQDSVTTSYGYAIEQIQATVGIKDTTNKLPASARARKS